MEIKNGTVFKFNNADDQYMVCDLITHRWNGITKRVAAFPDHHIVFRSVANINAWKPVHELMIISMHDFESDCTVLPLSERIKSNSSNNLE